MTLALTFTTQNATEPVKNTRLKRHAEDEDLESSGAGKNPRQNGDDRTQAHLASTQAELREETKAITG